MKQATIRISHVTTGYREHNQIQTLAQDLDVTLNSGELTCLLGSNGAGKSTLLRSISALQPLLDGDISVMGKSLKNYSHEELSRIISVVLTDKCHLQNMCVEELVSLGRSPYTGFWGGLQTKDVVMVNRALEWTGITDLRYRAVSTLSDGERQKTMIAKALAQETPIILLDEPTAFLDFPSKVETMQLLHRFTREMNKTILVTTHDVELALQIADKIWLMDNGRKMVVGTPEDLALNHSLADVFEQKDIVFEEMTGLFRVNRTLQMNLCLRGMPGPRLEMVRKALYRNGIQTVSERKGSLLVEVCDDCFVVEKTDGEQRKFITIEELLDCILEL